MAIYFVDSWFTYSKRWFSVAMENYQRVSHHFPFLGATHGAPDRDQPTERRAGDWLSPLHPYQADLHGACQGVSVSKISNPYM